MREKRKIRQLAGILLNKKKVATDEHGRTLTEKQKTRQRITRIVTNVFFIIHHSTFIIQRKNG
jgi:hypothetical protein